MAPRPPGAAPHGRSGWGKRVVPVTGQWRRRVGSRDPGHQRPPRDCQQRHAFRHRNRAQSVFGQGVYVGWGGLRRLGMQQHLRRDEERRAELHALRGEIVPIRQLDQPEVADDRPALMEQKVVRLQVAMMSRIRSGRRSPSRASSSGVAIGIAYHLTVSAPGSY